MKITIEIEVPLGNLPKIIELLGFHSVKPEEHKEDVFVSEPPLRYCKGCNQQFAFENEDTLYCSTCELKRAKHLRELAELKVSMGNPRKGIKVKQWKMFKCKVCGVDFKKQAHYALYCAKHREKHSHLKTDKPKTDKPAKSGKKRGRPVGSTKTAKKIIKNDGKKNTGDNFKLVYSDNGAVIGSTNYPPIAINNKHPAATNIDKRIEEGEFGEVTI